MSLNSGIMGIDLARRVFRLAWHALSLLMLVSAASVLWPGTPRGLILLIGAAWTATGLFDAVYTRGRHIGWPFLTASGLLAIAGAL
jgi:predicted anti-sigma-YlaC factor YlaD